MQGVQLLSWLSSLLATLNPVHAPPFNVIVEGNVGSGKSTFLDILQSWPGVETFPEPVAAWQEVGGQNLLEDMYSAPARWMTTFQLYSALTRTKQALTARASPARVAVLERSLYSGRFCFGEMARQQGVVTEGEDALLDRWFKMLTNSTTSSGGGLVPDLVVYIRSDPTILLQRVRGRARKLLVTKNLHIWKSGANNFTLF